MPLPSDKTILIIGYSGEQGDYSVTRILEHEAIPGPAYMLQRLNRDGTPIPNHAYAVALFDTGLQCTCADWVFRHRNTEETCKHCRRMIELGYFPTLIPRSRT